MPSVFRDAMLLATWTLLVAVLALFGNVSYEAGALDAEAAGAFAGVAHLAALALPFFMVAMVTDYLDEWRAKAAVYGFGGIIYVIQAVTLDPAQMVSSSMANSLVQFCVAFAAAHVLMVLSVYPPAEQRLENALADLGVGV
jgi:hypothetical protein